MKSKLLNFLLIITSLLGYLEWGGDNHTFLFQAEGQIVSALFTNPSSTTHPLTILPLIGQVLLIFTLFQNTPNKLLTHIGLGCLAILLFFMFAIGLMSLNYKILLSTIPFVIVSIITIIHYRGVSSGSSRRS